MFTITHLALTIDPLCLSCTHLVMRSSSQLKSDSLAMMFTGYQSLLFEAVMYPSLSTFCNPFRNSSSIRHCLLLVSSIFKD